MKSLVALKINYKKVYHTVREKIQVFQYNLTHHIF